jgi:hypothetical protein
MTVLVSQTVVEELLLVVADSVMGLLVDSDWDLVGHRWADSSLLSR